MASTLRIQGSGAVAYGPQEQPESPLARKIKNLFDISAAFRRGALSSGFVLNATKGLLEEASQQGTAAPV